ANPRQSNQAYFTFVALDAKTKRPTPVPPVIPITSEEKKQYEDALRRRELRLLLAGKLKAKNAAELKSLFDSFD
ncbi:MAG: hypothetical protein LC127_16280, partial [Chitinophagales bacterium]|nr:hypothetical protein [Chitinophagales bacterium]